MIKVLSFPSRHPYTSKFHGSGEILFANPETDYFNKIGGEATPEFISTKHPKDSYDLVHIHFSFDKLSVSELTKLLDYFDYIEKPIIWTCHSRESQREKNVEGGKLQGLLYARSKKIITLTEGCKSWIKNTYGASKDIEVVPLGYMLDPDALPKYKQNLSLKNKTNFVYLLGESRKNKESYFSIKDFLDSPELSGSNLTIILKPRFASDSTLNLTRSSSRIRLISMDEIPNKILAKTFCESHVCMLPYLWGTHSGQVELCKDCGCYPVISNVGFYREQSEQVFEFDYDENMSDFTKNFIKALVKATKMPLLTPNPEQRKTEFISILQRHNDLYRSALT